MLLNYISAWHLFNFFGTCYWTTFLHDISLISLAHVTELHFCMTSLSFLWHRLQNYRLHGISYHIFCTYYRTTFLHDVSNLSDTCYRTTSLHDISYDIFGTYDRTAPLHYVSLSCLWHVLANYIIAWHTFSCLWHMLLNYITAWHLLWSLPYSSWTENCTDLRRRKAPSLFSISETPVGPTIQSGDCQEECVQKIFYPKWYFCFKFSGYLIICSPCGFRGSILLTLW